MGEIKYIPSEINSSNFCPLPILIKVLFTSDILFLVTGFFLESRKKNLIALNKLSEVNKTYINIGNEQKFRLYKPPLVLSVKLMNCVHFRYSKHFKIDGTTNVHFGSFDCSATMASQQYNNDGNNSNFGCC